MRREPSIALQPMLDPDESLLWSGRPRQGIMFRGTDLFLVPFSLIWGGFAIFWEYMAVRMTANSPPFFALFGVPFVLIGLYMIFGRFIVDALVRKNTVYGVTSERILVLSGLFRRGLRSLDIRSLNEISLSEKEDGSGTIRFGPASPFGGGLGTAFLPGGHRIGGVRFEGIEMARSVYDTIREAQERASSPN